jgi:hypothetical protein
MDKIEISIELLQEIQSEMRKLRLSNMELHGQLMAVKRCVGALEMHLPRETEVEYIPPVIAKINQEIEKTLKSEKAKAQLEKAAETKKAK